MMDKKGPVDSYSFRVAPLSGSRTLAWDETMYYDTETIAWDEGELVFAADGADDDEIAESMRYLDIKNIGISMYVLMIPVKIINTKKKLKELQNMGIQTEIVSMYDAEFLRVWHYDAENRNNVKNSLISMLDAVCRQKKKQYKLVGYNNMKFDDLLFSERLGKGINCHKYFLPEDKGVDFDAAPVERDDSLTDEEETKKRAGLICGDLLHWGKCYGDGTGLKGIGKFLTVQCGIADAEKLEIKTESREDFITYAKRDVEILVHFLRVLNEHGFGEHRPSTNARKIVSSELFEAYDKKMEVDVRDPKTGVYHREEKPCPVERIFSGKKHADALPLIGGRTEPYYLTGNNIYYVDINSLYPYVMANFLFPKIQPGIPIHDVRKKRYYRNANIESVHTTLTAGRADLVYERIEKIREEILIQMRERKIFSPKSMKEVFERHLPWFGGLRVRLKGIHEKFKPWEKQLLHYFPLPRKYDGWTLFSMPEENDVIITVQFYEVMWLCFFEFDLLKGIEYPQTEKLPIREKILARYEKRKSIKAEGKRMKKEADRLEADGKSEEAAELRRRADNPEEKAIKLILNSGFGIFATGEKIFTDITPGDDFYTTAVAHWENRGRPPIFTYFPGDDEQLGELTPEQAMSKDEMLRIEDADFPYAEAPKQIFVRKHNNKFLFRMQTGDPDQRYATNTIPVWAQVITSGARFSIYSYMLNAILRDESLWEKLKIYYTDTDSMFTTKTMYEVLKEGDCIGNELGQLKLEHAEDKPLQKCAFLAPKSYVVVHADGEVEKKMKGVPNTWEGWIKTQSLTSDFCYFKRPALDARNKQKRVLQKDGSFFASPVPSDAGKEELSAAYEYLKKKYPDAKKDDKPENDTK